MGHGLEYFWRETVDLYFATEKTKESDLAFEFLVYDVTVEHQALELGKVF